MAIAKRKEARLHVRLSARQNELIRRAAEAAGESVTDFAVGSMTIQAEDVLADRRLFHIDDARWPEFLALLDRPPATKPRLGRLLSEPSGFFE